MWGHRKKRIKQKKNYELKEPFAGLVTSDPTNEMWSYFNMSEAKSTTATFLNNQQDKTVNMGN